MTKWTSDQLAAIEARGSDLLVSAAAGSGKTAVLVERVLRRLTDPKDPVDIDHFLLVTYTNAAASEMRGKLADAITTRLAEDPDDMRLRRQLLLVHKARITTVHAFCLTLVREQAAQLGLPPDFRLADESERSLLRDEVLEEVLEARYAAEDPAFAALCDLLTNGQDDRPLAAAVLDTFEKTRAHADPDAFLERVRAGLADDGSPAGTAHGALLLEQAREAAQYGLAFLHRALALLHEEETLEAAYAPALTSDVKQAEALVQAIEDKDWDKAVELAQGLHFDRLGSIRGYEDKDFQEEIKGLREEWKTVAGEIKDKLLCVTTEQAAYDRALVRPALEALIDTVEQFAQAFADEKRRRSLADFNDLEHFAVRLLYKDGKPSLLADRLAASFCEILVDEYQDTNGVQDAIFSAIARDNLFMVGDVKQSIYGFRLADPYIFLEKYRAFADEPQHGQGRRVVLSKNFRSRAEVLDTVNYIFRAVMSEAVGDLDYTDREALYVGADYPEQAPGTDDTELWLLDTAEDEGGTDKAMLEARMAARRIRALLDEGFRVTDRDAGGTRPLRASDVVILMRSPKARAATYRAALAEYGLAAQTEESAGLLQTREVGVIVSFLSIIDNPRQDVQLIGVMRSPLFGFSEEELAEIRLLDRKASFYDAARLSPSDRVQTFLRTLDDLRMLSCDLPVYQLLWRIYDQTGALGVFGAMPGGAQRQRNLLSFFERARGFEQAGTRGLFRFVRLLRAMEESGDDFETVRAEGGEGAVRIMSIHKSKGLEFPVVVLADTAKRFNERDLTAPVLVHPALGFGAKCRDLKRGVRYDTMERQAVAVRMRRRAVSEELRVLYVALTRPKEKLIITCASAQFTTQLSRLARLAALDQLPPYAMGSVRAPMAWILAPLLRHPRAGCLRQTVGATVEMDGKAPDRIAFHLVRPADLTGMARPQPQAVSFSDLPAIPPALRYPDAVLADIPAKLTATGLKTDYKSRETVEDTRPARPAPALRRPDFEQQARGLTPAEQGTAHHLFMQFCDFDACAAGRVREEIARLKEKAILSPEQADAVRPERIAAFFQSDLYHQYMQAGEIRREFKFSVTVPAADYYPEVRGADEEVLLQGVVDCMSETAEGFLIVDFKTDRVSGAAVQARAETYRPQLDAYRVAVEKIFDKPVIGRALYFFSSRQTVFL